jgi:hypothetical protein
MKGIGIIDPDRSSTAPIKSILHPCGEIVKKHNIYINMQKETVTASARNMDIAKRIKAPKLSGALIP